MANTQRDWKNLVVRGEYPDRTLDIVFWPEQAFGAVVAAVINEIVGIPAGAPCAHLSQPGPHVARGAANGDGVLTEPIACGMRSSPARERAHSLGGSRGLAYRRTSRVLRA